MSASVGADVEALCSKCGDVWHVVVAKVGDQIVKVHCKECNKEHRYKNPHGAPKAVRQPSLTTPKPERAEGSGRAIREACGRRGSVRARARRIARPRAYAVGERVEHPNFGQGVVEVSESGKVTVFFATGRRVLVQAKAARPSALERPKPFDHSNTAGGKPVGQT